MVIFSVAPTILELVLSVTVLRRRFASHAFGLIALGTFGLYATAEGRRRKRSSTATQYMFGAGGQMMGRRLESR